MLVPFCAIPYASRASGFRISTSGASERKGIVQRLDVGTSGVMVICKSEHAYSVLKDAFRHRLVLTYQALAEERSADDVLDAVIAAVPQPRLELGRPAAA